MTAVQQSTTGTRHQYSVIVNYDPEDDAYYATVPALGFVTDGTSIEDAFAMAEEAISLRVELVLAAGEELPAEDPPIPVRMISV